MRYLVFEYDQYYPQGGMEDCTLKTDNIVLARIHARVSQCDSAVIYDTVTGEEVAKES